MTTAIIPSPLVVVIEELMPNERMSVVNRRISRFLHGGVAVVWLIDPEERAITIFRPGGPPEVLEGNEVLTGDGTMSEFRNRVADFFSEAEEANAVVKPPTAS